ncbi:MAG: sulfite exporter TauE/SafE family protein [Chloroflexota bacterium]
MIDGLAGLSLPTMLLAVAIMAVGSGLQAALGMGLGLFVVPLLALLDERFVPGPILVAAILLSLGMARRERHAIEWAGLRIAIAGLLVGTVAGAVILSLVNAAYLPRLFGALILFLVTLTVCGVRVSPGQPALLAVGAISGVMGAMVGIHGPLIALVLQDSSPSRLRAMLAAFFLVGYVSGVIALAGAGLLGLEHLLLGVVLIPGAIVGYLAGPFLARRLDRKLLRVGILTVSTISAVSLLLK